MNGRLRLSILSYTAVAAAQALSESLKNSSSAFQMPFLRLEAILSSTVKLDNLQDRGSLSEHVRPRS
jgi:hypothetical protein